MRIESAIKSVSRSGVRRSSRRAGHIPGPVLFIRLVAMLLAGVLATMVPVAYSSPPDQTWITGLYDDADYDDAVLAITDASGSPAIDGPAISPADLSSTALPFSGPTRPAATSRIRPLDRAPPLS